MEQQLNTAWFESPSTRLSQWRVFRKGLDTDNTYEVLKFNIWYDQDGESGEEWYIEMDKENMIL